LAGDTTFEINLTTGLDWGDASEGYPVTSADNGANHLVADGFYLGSSVDIEPDGIHSELYDADDTDGSPDDEDGLINIDELEDLKPGKIYKLQVEVNGIGSARPGFVDAWIDFNHDESWDGFIGDHPTAIDPVTEEPVQVEVSEKLKFFSTVDSVDPITGEPTAISGEVTIVNGLNDLYFTVPPQSQSSCPSLRIRLSSEGTDLPTGSASDGEVEDYQLFTHSSDWHNTAISEDVNKDGFVTPIDALLVINYLNNDVPSGGDGQLPSRSAAENGTPPLVDVNDDGFVSSIDALRVVNYIHTANGEAEGEGEDVLMMSYGVTEVTVSSASIADLVEPIASRVLVDSPVLASPERVRESQFAELDLSRETSLDAVLADIGGEVSDLRETEEGHDEFFASVQY
jgi:hypothetical protein